jgi:hypothetical protein
VANDKPVSLAPLTFEQALTALLKINPSSKEERLSALDRASAKHDESLAAARKRAQRRRRS